MFFWNIGIVLHGSSDLLLLQLQFVFFYLFDCNAHTLNIVPNDHLNVIDTPKLSCTPHTFSHTKCILDKLKKILFTCQSKSWWINGFIPKKVQKETRKFITSTLTTKRICEIRFGVGSKWDATGGGLIFRCCWHFFFRRPKYVCECNIICYCIILAYCRIVKCGIMPWNLFIWLLNRKQSLVLTSIRWCVDSWWRWCVWHDASSSDYLSPCDQIQLSNHLPATRRRERKESTEKKNIWCIY